VLPYCVCVHVFRLDCDVYLHETRCKQQLIVCLQHSRQVSVALLRLNFKTNNGYNTRKGLKDRKSPQSNINY